MIDVEVLRRGPWESVVRPRIFPADYQVRYALDEKLDDARRVAEHTRLLINKPRRASEFPLFKIDAGKTVSIGGEVSSYPKQRVQEIGLAVMKELGLNTDIRGTYYDAQGRARIGIENIFDGTYIETFSYPSQTIPGLNFLRRRHYYHDNGESISVEWSAQAFPKPFSAHFRRR